MARTRINFTALLFALFVFAYFLVFLVSPSFAPTDDFIFMRTLQEGKPILYYAADFPYYDTAKIGRFTPLAAMEYNAALLFTSLPSPLWYYFAHAIQFVILIFLLLRILRNYTDNQPLIYLTIGLFVLTPGFTFSWFRLQMNERDVVFFLAIFVYCYQRYLRQPRLGLLVAAAAAANMVIYYKETGFILVGAFSATYLILAWKTLDRKLKAFHVLLLLSVATYLAIYAVLILPYGGVFVYGKGGAMSQWLVLAKNMLNFTFVADPFIMLVVVPLTIWRIYEVFVKRMPSEPFHDALLAASTAFVSSYFVLNLWGYYYFQPTYVLAMPALFYFGSKIWRQWAWRSVALLAGFLFVTNALPLGLHYLTYYKYLPANFDAALGFIAHDIQAKNGKERPAVFIDGLDRGSGKFMYFIFSEFLRNKGLVEKDFDMKSDVESDIVNEQPFPFLEKVPTPFTVFKKGPLPKVSEGDYLILSPQSTDSVKDLDNAAYLRLLEKDYDLVFKSTSPLAFPMLNLKAVGRYMLSIGAKPGDRFLSISRHRPSFERPDYYVYRHK